MDIKRFFSSLTGRSDTNVLHTPYGSFNLAKEDDRQRVKHVVMTLQRTTDALTRKDIADWRRAWQLAINVDEPNRQRLYDIYRDAEVDAHLSGCVRQRQGFVMARTFKIIDAKENENKEALHYFDQSWFKQLCRLALDSVYWGHSLIELGDIVQDGDGMRCYDCVKLIPRKHVIPEYGRVVRQVGDDWKTGVDFHRPPYSDWLIEAGQPDDLGLFLKAAQHTIPKKNMLAFWDTFGEIFGMPMRIAKTASRDGKEIDRLNRMLVEAGASQTAVMPLDTELEFIESTRGDAYNVYNQRVDRANSELSKLIIGQTMTIEDGSSLSQSQTHLQVFQNLVEEDADMLRDIINNQLLPRMVAHGFPLQGFRFDWDYSTDYTPEQQVAYETMVADRYEVDPSYFAEKYSMPVGERRNNMMPTMEPQDDSEDNSHANEKNGTRSNSRVQPGITEGKKEQDKKDPDKNKQQKNTHPFFRPSPAGRDSFRLVVNDLYYGHEEKCCLASTEKSFAISDEVIEHALHNIYRRNFNPKTDIEPAFFHAFVSTLNSAADKGIRQAQKPEDDFLNALRHNTDVFAAFKTHRLQNDVARKLMDSNGNLKPFERWKNDVQDITSHQCKAWLRTEYDTAVLRARQAANWQQFQREKDVLPNLEWMPSTSPNPGEDHMPFWGTILPVDHPFWEQHRPGDRWNCKCDLRSTDKSATNVPHDSTAAHDPQPGLDNNPGSTAQIFAKSHPYIKNAHPGAKKAVQEAVRQIEKTRKKFEQYDETEWERAYKSEKANGFVVTEKQRMQEAKKSKQAAKIYIKELTMCQVAADNGYWVEFLHGERKQKGNSYDVTLNDIPADLKATTSHNNIAKYARYATKEQGAKAVLFELAKRGKYMSEALKEAKRKCPHTRILYYYADEKIIREV